MSVEKHRTLLFVDNYEFGRQTLGRCVATHGTIHDEEGGLILPDVQGHEEEGGPGWRQVPQVGRETGLKVWDGKPGAPWNGDVLSFPDLEQTASAVTWQGQNFQAHCTQWESLHSPLVVNSPRPKPTPVLDACGVVVGYFLRKVSTDYLFATEVGEVFFSSRSELIDGQRKVREWNMYTMPLQVSQDGKAAEASSLKEAYVVWKNKWMDVLLDVDGFVLAIDMYGDEPPLWQTLWGLILPTPPSNECFFEAMDGEESLGCAGERAMFMVELFLLLTPLRAGAGAVKGGKLISNLIRTGSKARDIGRRLMRARINGVGGGRLGVTTLALDLPKVAKKATSGGKQAKLVLAAEKSDKKANFMKVDLGQKTGMTHMAIRDVRYKMIKNGVRVRFRPAGAARKLRKRGAVPKWEELKMKTINDDDILLGAPKSGKNQPGYFEPKLPDPKLKQTDPKRYEKVMERYKQRKEEFKALADKVKKYEKDGDIKVENGVVKDGETGKEIAGDYDIFEILDKNGKRITANDPRYEKILKDLEGRRIGAEHGRHVEWKPKDPFEKKIYDEIIDRHRSKEPLYEFREDGSVWETFAD